MDDVEETTDLEEKRVFGHRAGKTDLVVAAEIGVLAVEVSADRIGTFGVAHRCDPVDVAASGGRVAVATDQDVLVREAGNETFAPTDFGPTVAVGFDDDDAPVAAGPDGGVSRLSSDGTDPEWIELGRLGAEVRAIDGRLLAAAAGVYRLPGLEYAGLDDAWDVAAAGPLAATGEGLYSLGNGWMDELAGSSRVVATDGDRAHAVSADAFFERVSGEWREVALPADDPVVDVAYGTGAYAVTADGVLLARGEGGWRAHSLGVSGVVGCAAG